MQATPRIAPAAPPLEPGLQDALARLLPPGMPAPRLFLAVGRNAGLFRFMVDSGWIGPTGLLDRRTLPKALRETVILRTCVATRNDYEFNLHVQTVSLRMGLSPRQVDDIRNPACDARLWDGPHLAAIALVDALVRREVDDGTYARARAAFDESMLVEITQLAGMYVGVAMQVALARPAFDTYRWREPVLTDPASPGIAGR